MGECELYLLWHCDSKGRSADEAGRVHCDSRALDRFTTDMDLDIAAKLGCFQEEQCDDGLAQWETIVKERQPLLC